MDLTRDRPEGEELPAIELLISPLRKNGKRYVSNHSFELGELKPLVDYTVVRYVPEARALALERRIEELEEARTENYLRAIAMPSDSCGGSNGSVALAACSVM